MPKGSKLFAGFMLATTLSSVGGALYMTGTAAIYGLTDDFTRASACEAALKEDKMTDFCTPDDIQSVLEKKANETRQAQGIGLAGLGLFSGALFTREMRALRKNS